MAEHPFILEFPLKASGLWEITKHRRMQEHRKLTLLLNVLLAGQTSFQTSRPNSFWARDPFAGDFPESKWVQEHFSGKLGKEAVTEELSTPAGDQLQEVEPEEYYAKVGHDGQGLRIPADLDQSICLYRQLLPKNRVKFDRSAFWVSTSHRQWTISMSSSFASLVSAVESLTSRGEKHETRCEVCNDKVSHEVPGATERFRNFFENYAPGQTRKEQRSKMYALRSRILHGSELMELDRDLVFGWDPSWLNEQELIDDLWGMTKLALRNWLKDPPAN